jgi:hypothetical protein
MSCYVRLVQVTPGEFRSGQFMSEYDRLRKVMSC